MAALAGCGGTGGKDDVCSDKDGALTSAAFVFVDSPASGERVSSGFQVTGCSSTSGITFVIGGKPSFVTRGDETVSRPISRAGAE